VSIEHRVHHTRVVGQTTEVNSWRNSARYRTATHIHTTRSHLHQKQHPPPTRAYLSRCSCLSRNRSISLISIFSPASSTATCSANVAVMTTPLLLAPSISPSRRL
jgi:hypothetical protein